jgi:hypothetical protein
MKKILEWLLIVALSVNLSWAGGFTTNLTDVTARAAAAAAQTTANTGVTNAAAAQTTANNAVPRGMSAITNSLTTGVNITTTTFVDGPSVAQGTSGTWFASGGVMIYDGTAGDSYRIKLWDGNSIIDSKLVALTAIGSLGSGYRAKCSLSGIISNPAGNIRISVAATGPTTGAIESNESGQGKDSTLTAIRID